MDSNKYNDKSIEALIKNDKLFNNLMNEDPQYIKAVLNILIFNLYLSMNG